MQGWWERSVTTGGVRGGHFPFFASLHSTQAGTRKEAESRGLQLRNHNISWSNHKSDSSYFCHTLLGRGGSSGPAHNQGEVMTEKHKFQPARMTEHSIRRCPSPGCPGKSLMWLLQVELPALSITLCHVTGWSTEKLELVRTAYFVCMFGNRIFLEN